MYTITCDRTLIYNPKVKNLTLIEPKCKLGVNTVGEASFSMLSTHPYYKEIKKLRSVFEIRQNNHVIFRGRATNDTVDFDNIKNVDIEGVMAYFNDSVIAPFSFPEDFQNSAEYQEASSTGNVVKYFLQQLILQHNNAVKEHQKFKLGNVTVTDPNNYITRSSEEYLTTWEVLKTRLFESSLGGYLCIRYEWDGNYIDYLSDFTETNPQKIVFGRNLLDISREVDAASIYTAVIPLGAMDDTESSRLTLNDGDLPEGEVAAGITRDGVRLINTSLSDEYGIICAPVSDTTWEDVTIAKNLLQRGIDYLQNVGSKLLSTVTINAVDLHFSNETIEEFRIYKYVAIKSDPHDLDDSYRLTCLEIDLQNPQNTVITLGDTQANLLDINSSNKKAISSEILYVNQNANASNQDLKILSNELAEVKSGYTAADKKLKKQIDDVVTFLGGEWTELTTAGGFVASSEDVPMYKVMGNVVEFKGAVSPSSIYTSSEEKTLLASGILSAHCPATERNFICQGTGMNRWLLTVSTDGKLMISRYGITEPASVSTTESLTFNGTYMISTE